MIIALPEIYTRYKPQEVLEDFTEEFRKRYGVECVSALHHNKRKTNYHIHLIFSERKLLPNLFRGIVAKAKDFLQNLIREKDMPPKPTLDIDMAEFRHMRNLMIKVQDKAVKIKNLQDKVLPQSKQQLADTKGLFKGKERKALEVKIKETDAEIADRLDKIPDTSLCYIKPLATEYRYSICHSHI